jgi:hypothetical protein
VESGRATTKLNRAGVLHVTQALSMPNTGRLWSQRHKAMLVNNLDE